MSNPNPPSRRGPGGRVPGRPPAPPPGRPAGGRPSTVRGGVPRAPQAPQGEGGPEAGPGGVDKRILWAAGGAAVLILVVVVALNMGKGKPPPAKKSADGEATASGVIRFPSVDTPEGREEIRKMFEQLDYTRCRKYISAISKVTAAKIPDILVPYLMRLDAGAGFTEAYSLARLLEDANDPRVVGKIIDLGLQKKDAMSLLRTYGAAGSEIVIARATEAAKAGADLAPYEAMLTECLHKEGAAGPLRQTAESGEIAAVAWICGDALSRNKLPISEARVRAWLAEAEPRAVMSGIRQASVQTSMDRDAAILPFTTPETSIEVRRVVLEVAGPDATLSKQLIGNLIQIDDLESFEDVCAKLVECRRRDFAPELQAVSDARTGSAIGRRAGNTAQQLSGSAGTR